MYKIDQKVTELIKDIPIIEKSYIVGGANRDIILKKKLKITIF
ncbi:hypothetical protein [Natranaerofaba carboxydovora]|nr:hypothetical protein [Natranaerofaba carboxydovora]